MARIRTIKPDIWDSEKVGRRTILERLTFIGLISQADDSGRGRADPILIRSKLHPYDHSVTPEMCAAALDALKDVGLVHLYQREGTAYYFLPGFKDNQVINRPQPSSLPPYRRETDVQLPLTDHSVNGHWRNGMEWKGMEGNGSTTAAPPAAEGAPKKLTPLQQVVRGFKISMGVPKDDVAWDAVYFKRFSRPAKELLTLCRGDVGQALDCIEHLVKGFEKNKLSWTPETIVKHASDYIHKKAPR